MHGTFKERLPWYTGFGWGRGGKASGEDSAQDADARRTPVRSGWGNSGYSMATTPVFLLENCWTVELGRLGGCAAVDKD